MGKVLVIDGSHAAHRSFHSVPPMNAPDGRPTNAVHGFLSILAKALDDFNPDQIIVAWDRGKPPHRMEALETYKANRPPMDPEFKVQFGIIESVLDAMSITQCYVKGWEADDCIGSLTLLNKEAGGESVVLTGDRDMLQLVDEATTQARPGNGGTFSLYGPAEVEAEFGVRPDQYVDYMALKGDASDGIPGVKGIGAKGASKLIAEYGSLENLLAHADEVPGKAGQLLLGQADQARMSYGVALICRDLDIDFDPDARWGGFSSDADSALRELALNSMAARFSRLAADQVPPRPAPSMESLF